MKKIQITSTLILVAIALLAILVAGGLYADRFYNPPEPPPEILYTIKGPVVVHHEVVPGDLVTAPNLGTIYYVNQERERLVFPDEQTYGSWYEDFTDVKTIPRDLLEAMPLSGRNVNIRPGTYLVTIPSSSQVWAISHPNSLWWLSGGESQVAAFYGDNWKERLVDLPEYFFVNYHSGTEIGIDENLYPTGSVVHAKNDDTYYLVAGHEQRIITQKGFEENRFQKRFVIQKDQMLSLPLAAPALDEYEPMWGSPDYTEANE